MLSSLAVCIRGRAPDLLNSAGSVTITNEDVIFLNGKNAKDATQGRREQIRSVLDDPMTDGYGRTKLQERLANPSSGVAVIKVGDSSELGSTRRTTMTMR